MLDLGSLQLFVRAAELGSLSKTGDQMNLALAAVSRRIAQLEHYYGVSLFTRTGRGVELTPAGYSLLERARDILSRIGEARADLSDFAKGVRGAVRVYASTSSICQFLPQDLAAFHDACPDIRLDVREATSADIMTAVRDGHADVGIIVGGPHAVNLVTAPYKRDRLVIVAPADFAPGMERARLAELIEHEFVVLEDQTATTRLLTSVALSEGLVVRFRVKMGSFDAVCRMVQAGFGLGVLPHLAARHYASSLGLQLIELEDDWAERQMIICTSAAHRPSLATEQLVAHLVAAARDSV